LVSIQETSENWEKRHINRSFTLRFLGISEKWNFIVLLAVIKGVIKKNI
jgi:hypothetical protein